MDGFCNMKPWYALAVHVNACHCDIVTCMAHLLHLVRLRCSILRRAEQSLEIAIAQHRSTVQTCGCMASALGCPAGLPGLSKDGQQALIGRSIIERLSF